MPELPISRRHALVAAAAVLVLLVLVGRQLAGTGAPAAARPVVVQANPASEARAALVHVVGAVRRPGLYRLRDGARVADAVSRAGGATRGADLALINLAAPVADGAQVVVPRRQPVAGEGAVTAGAAAGPVHLNTATLEQLDALPGVGPATAQGILDYRSENGAFATVDELDAVPGIGPARLEQLRDLVAP